MILFPLYLILLASGFFFYIAIFISADKIIPEVFVGRGDTGLAPTRVSLLPKAKKYVFIILPKNKHFGGEELQPPI